MAEPRRRYITPQSRPLSADCDMRGKESMLFSMLPSAVQSRLSRLPSLRRSTSMYGLTTPQKSTEFITGSAPSSGTSTPRLGHMNALVLSSAADELAGSLGDSEFSEEDTATNYREPLERSEMSREISWKYANQGLSLLSHAVEESTSGSQDPRFSNAMFSRQLYIHSITYLLRALPGDLTPDERSNVRSSLPRGAMDNSRFEGHHYSRESPYTNEQPSILHRTLASTIVQLFVLFQVILPYVKLILASAYQYERKHKISAKVLSQSIDTVDSIGKTGVTVTEALYGLNDGKVGQAITEAATWVVEGVTGGIQEGIGEGLMILGATKPFQGRSQR